MGNFLTRNGLTLRYDYGQITKTSKITYDHLSERLKAYGGSQEHTSGIPSAAGNQAALW